MFLPIYEVFRAPGSPKLRVKLSILFLIYQMIIGYHTMISLIRKMETAKKLGVGLRTSVCHH